MTVTMAQKNIDIYTLFRFLNKHALIEELDELARILKCPTNKRKKKTEFAKVITKKLFKCYQTPAGYVLRNPTIDQMCDRIAKKLKLHDLQGDAWQRLHSLCINIFEKLFKSMTPEEKEKLMQEMWAQLSDEDKQQLKDEFNIADVSAFIHTSELMFAHIAGVYLARETALYAAAAVLRISLSVELTLAAGTILTRTATVFLGPVGWALIAVSINDLMGTNFKRLVPAMLTVNIINMRVHGNQGKEFFRFLTDMQT
jgi:uncharacterized protein YaaW (UPF0174 family)